ncbi:DUF4912 domain-containing protein [Anaerolineales bacterium HSG25]|nr:DUF4912 domain-containing protein [Anaerolineales bacterium HSG25]
MSKKKQAKTGIAQDRMREISWEVGQFYPINYTADYIALSMINPQQGHVHWNLRQDSLTALKAENDQLAFAPLVVRIYDVSDVIFDGFNAHSFFDAEVHNLSGNYYFQVPQLGRSYHAEIGLRADDGIYAYLARSNTMFFERDRPSGDYDTSALFVEGTLGQSFQVENMFDASVYEHINRALAGLDRHNPLPVAMVCLGLDPQVGLDTPLGHFIQNVATRLEKFGGHVELFHADVDFSPAEHETMIKRVDATSKTVFEKLRVVHKKKPFHLVHCHDWYSSRVGLLAARKLNLPLVVSLHSTEYERVQGYHIEGLSALICEWEQEAVRSAQLVMVPRESTRDQVIKLYKVSSERVVVIPDVLSDESHTR